MIVDNVSIFFYDSLQKNRDKFNNNMNNYFWTDAIAIVFA